MCISNIGNRRPYPVAGMVRKAPPSLPEQSRVVLKDEFQIRSSLAAAASASSSSSSSSIPEPRPLPAPQEESDKPRGAHIIVQHDYHDHANDNRADYKEDAPARGGVTTPFPLRLHEMLDNIAADGLDHVISWQPHGRCFVVHKPKEFGELLPKYFKLSKLASFQRQLNLYGFQRLTKGQDRGGYYHELFLRGRVFLAHAIHRIKVKGTGVRARSNPDQEPHFWSMPFVGDYKQDTTKSDTTSRHTVTDKAVAQLPLQVTPPVPLAFPSFSEEKKQETEDQTDVFSAFGAKTFHYLDPFAPTTEGPSKWTVSGVDQLLASEAETFFEDFTFPENITKDIEDDDVFGDMLEEMIA